MKLSLFFFYFTSFIILFSLTNATQETESIFPLVYPCNICIKFFQTIKKYGYATPEMVCKKIHIPKQTSIKCTQFQGNKCIAPKIEKKDHHQQDLIDQITSKKINKEIMKNKRIHNKFFHPNPFEQLFDESKILIKNGDNQPDLNASPFPDAKSFGIKPITDDSFGTPLPSQQTNSHLDFNPWGSTGYPPPTYITDDWCVTLVEELNNHPFVTKLVKQGCTFNNHHRIVFTNHCPAPVSCSCLKSMQRMQAFCDSNIVKPTCIRIGNANKRRSRKSHVDTKELDTSTKLFGVKMNEQGNSLWDIIRQAKISTETMLAIAKGKAEKAMRDAKRLAENPPPPPPPEAF